MTDHTAGLPRDKDAAQPSSLNFLVVGLGASAGGLVALKTFVEQMPIQSGMAFVVIMHLSPRHESHADAVLQRSTGMPVAQVQATTPIQTNHVYVISPRQELRMSDGVLEVKPVERPRGRHSASAWPWSSSWWNCMAAASRRRRRAWTAARSSPYGCRASPIRWPA